MEDLIVFSNYQVFDAAVWSLYQRHIVGKDMFIKSC